MKNRLGALLIIGTGAGLLTLADGTQEATTVVAQSAVEDGCPETSVPESQTGTTLEGFAIDTNGGVVYTSSGGGSLGLEMQGGLFKQTMMPVTEQFNAVDVADFDEDGWVDIIASHTNENYVRFFKNETGGGPNYNSIDWTDPDDVAPPIFTGAKKSDGTILYVDGDGAGNLSDTHQNYDPEKNVGPPSLIAGDYNNDGYADFVYIRNHSLLKGKPTKSAEMFLGKGDGTFEPKYDLLANSIPPSALGNNAKGATGKAIDWNGDGYLDFLFPSLETPPPLNSNFNTRYDANSAQMLVLINNCNSNSCTEPKFTPQQVLNGMNLGWAGINTFGFADFTGDGIEDFVLASPTCCSDITDLNNNRISLLVGYGNRQFAPPTPIHQDPNNHSLTNGRASALLVADFSLDGNMDFLIGTDDWGGRIPALPNPNSNNAGGYAHYYPNNGSSTTPFSDGATQTLSERGDPISNTSLLLQDYDSGAAIDYDHDPDNTPDALIVDGNHAESFYVFANRTSGSQYVDCGEVQSGVLDLGGLDGEEMLIKAARLEPTMTLNGGTIFYYVSNETPENWIPTYPCGGSGVDAYCGVFPNVGTEVRWKAEMCGDKATTPTISGMTVSFDYVEAEEHYRAGVVVNDGVAYVGAFQQPGNSGHFYALNAGLTKEYWDFADSLNAMTDADRNIYTSDKAGTTRLNFDVSNATSADLQATLGVGAANTNQAEAVINWQRSARFGVADDSKLGSVENSTPAVVGPPSLPNWYPRASDADRQLMDTFITEHKDRPIVVLVGSRDGALHAVRSTPTDITNQTINGPEAWAYIPALIAGDMLSDYTNSIETAYPDGSPTVADVILDDGKVHTVAIVGGGNGHSSVVALDITETIDEDNGTILGPQPLWHLIPGDSLAGPAVSKPVVARVNIAGTSKFYAIMGTGIASNSSSKGRDVVAVDMTTGAVVWKFQAECPLTSDIVTFETNDVLETGSPTYDGYIDRVVFADACGNVYKLDPAQNVGSDYITGLGTIPTGHSDPDGNGIDALFSTVLTTCAIGGERPIAGTIGARTDSTNRLTLFFGTGGVESFDPALDNALYAVYADTGEIRGCSDGTPDKGRVEGDCTAGVCEKFYGGVVVTESDVIATRATDPPVGTATCEFGSSTVSGFSTSQFNSTFNVPISGGATVSSLYGDGGAIYFTTLAGDIVKIGDARAEEAGDDSDSGITGESTIDDGGSTGCCMGVLGWRVVK